MVDNGYRMVGEEDSDHVEPGVDAELLLPGQPGQGRLGNLPLLEGGERQLRQTE